MSNKVCRERLADSGITLIEAIEEAIECVEDAKSVPADVVAVLLWGLDVPVVPG